MYEVLKLKKKKQTVQWKLSDNYSVKLGCTNHGRQVARATKFCTVARDVISIISPFLAPRI